MKATRVDLLSCRSPICTTRIIPAKYCHCVHSVNCFSAIRQSLVSFSGVCRHQRRAKSKTLLTIQAAFAKLVGRSKSEIKGTSTINAMVIQRSALDALNSTTGIKDSCRTISLAWARLYRWVRFNVRLPLGS